jgi:Trypsin
MSNIVKRRLLITAIVLIVLAITTFVIRERFVAAAIAINTCSACSTSEKAGEAANAFRNPDEFVRSAEIIGGRPTDPTEFPTVGAILRNGTLKCTGTLIAPRTVLTAGHCVHGFAPTSLSFQPTLVVTPAAPRFEVIAAFAANQSPLIYRPGTASSESAHDIGLMILRNDPAPGLARLPLSSGAPAITVGGRIQKVGYGFSKLKPKQSGDGTQRVVELEINAVESFRFKHGKAGLSICNRDSGGPGIISQTIVGVTSTTGSCRKGTDTRVAPYLQWIQANKQ